MKILPCPFCGYDDKDAKYASDALAVCDAGNGVDWYVMCAKCEAQGPLSDEDNAAEAWNKRFNVEEK